VSKGRGVDAGSRVKEEDRIKEDRFKEQGERIKTGLRIKGKTRKMKDSGVEWIGEIPEDWEVRKYKNFAISGMGNTILKEELAEKGIPVYSATRDDVVFGYLEKPNLVLNKGDFVIPARGNSIGYMYMIREEKATCTQTTIYSRIKNINKRFLLYCGKGLRNYWFEFDNTAIPQITVNQVQNNIVPFPTFEEQEKIANFLDEKVSLIDYTIEKTKQSIEDCKKYKQALITETVTKGLNPDVEMKQSGIEWVGEVPKHWRIIRIKHLATVNPNKSEIKHLSLDSEVTFIPMEKIIGPGQVDYSLSNTIENLINGYTYFKDGDIIMAKVTPCFENSNIAIVNGMKNGIGFGTTELHVLRCNDKCYNKYLFYYLQSSVFVLKGISKMYGVGGLKRVSEDFVSNHKLAVPSYEEQKQIADYLDKKCSEIGKIISQKEQLIKELEDYKKSLIYEYVTGKKRVV